MVHLRDIFDINELNTAITDGLVNVQTDGVLNIYNYTNQAAYSRAWNPVTKSCRGLIADNSGNVIARPFSKFFNPSEPDAPPIPVGQTMQITEKLDGSLGVAYRHPSKGIQISTRGSLGSKQAVEATSIWQERYSHVDIPEGVTPLFEIVYPENRIVVDYGKTRDLFLLAVINNATGADLPLSTIDWTGPRAEILSFDSFEELHRHAEQYAELDSEGYVVRFGGYGNSPNIRLKIKFPTYVAYHRIITGFTTLRVWETAAVRAGARNNVPIKAIAHRLHLSSETVSGLLADGDDPVETTRRNLPEEFLPWYNATVNEMCDKVNEITKQYTDLIAQAERLAEDDSPRAFAVQVQRMAEQTGLNVGTIFAFKNKYPQALLTVWHQIRPQGKQEMFDSRLADLALSASA